MYKLYNAEKNIQADWNAIDGDTQTLNKPVVGYDGLTQNNFTDDYKNKLIASPFNGLLAEKTALLLTGQAVPDLATAQVLLSFPKSIGRELTKLLYYIPLALVVLVISFIPLINTVAPLLWFLLGSWMMAIQYCDYPMDNHHASFAATKQRITLTGLTSCGFGAGVMLATMIPLVNLMIMPAAVCGATAYWVKEIRET